MRIYSTRQCFSRAELLLLEYIAGSLDYPIRRPDELNVTQIPRSTGCRCVDLLIPKVDEY